MNPATLAPHSRLGRTPSLDSSPDHLLPALKQIYKPTPYEFNARMGDKKDKTHLISLSHDVLQFLVNLRRRPRESLAVLRHLETRHGDTTAVRRLSRRVPHTALALLARRLEDLDGGLRAPHVGSLSDDPDAGLHERLCLLGGNLVLGGTGERNVDLGDECPGALTYQEEGSS